jgi:outer membrane protein OmpA-like peptidoglycan-associated protein
MRNRQIKRATAVACALFLAGCATNPNGQTADPAQQFKQFFASDDPCSNNARNIGVVGGVVAGTILANMMGGGKAESLATGALIGGFLGGLIGADMDRKRCELSKVAKQYNLDITFSPIDVNGDVMDTGSAAGKPADKVTPAQSAVGTTLTIRDKGGVAGHFESGSDQLTPKAKEYFAAIAAQYGSEKMLEGQTDAKRREEIGKQIAVRRLLLIGHTDDTGSSPLNASLSERRARSVASFLKQHGIKEDSLYFQGAGETLPVSDNRTDAGRAENRRVEILEIADESGFKKYLAARKPNYQFYRPKEADALLTANTAKPVAATASTTPATRAKTTAQNAPAIAATPAQRPAVALAPTVNFGGSPYSPGVATLNVGSLAPTKTSFSLISKAYADDSVVSLDCTHDRPRAAGAVKSLKDGTTYKTNEHIPQLYGKTWAGDVNGNLVVINRLAVLRDGGTPANLPELKVYAQYKPETAKKPEVSEEPQVNSYLVGQGVLYRMFPRGDAGLRCVDVLFGTDGSSSAKGGKIVYGTKADSYVASFKPQIQ